MTGRTWRIGIVGASTIADMCHIPGYEEQPDARIVAVCDTHEGRAAAAAAPFEARVFTDPGELADWDGVDAVSICTPNATHAPLAITLLRAGKHVLCEKPPALNADEARQMQAAAKAGGATLMYCLNFRFRPDIRTLKAYVDAGDLGEIYHARTSMLRRRGAPIGSWFASKALAGGGPLIDLGVHCFDWTYYLMGQPAPVSVFGATHRRIGAYAIEDLQAWTPAEMRGIRPATVSTGEVEELATALIRFANGATLSLEVSWVLNTAANATSTEIYGTRAGAKLDPLTLFYDENGRMVNKMPQVPEYPYPRMHALAIRHFLDCLAEGREPITPASYGVRIMTILDAIYASAESGQAVTLDPAVV